MPISIPRGGFDFLDNAYWIERLKECLKDTDDDLSHAVELAVEAIQGDSYTDEHNALVVLLRAFGVIGAHPSKNWTSCPGCTSDYLRHEGRQTAVHCHWCPHAQKQP